MVLRWRVRTCTLQDSGPVLQWLRCLPPSLRTLHHNHRLAFKQSICTDSVLPLFCFQTAVFKNRIYCLWLKPIEFYWFNGNSLPTCQIYILCFFKNLIRFHFLSRQFDLWSLYCYWNLLLLFGGLRDLEIKGHASVKLTVSQFVVSAKCLKCTMLIRQITFFLQSV